MKTLTKTALVAVSIAALGCVSTAASAADPVVLPVQDTAYQASFFSDPALLWTTASDGAGALIGDPETAGLYAVTDGAWNPVTGKAYVVGNGYDGPCELWEADMATGQFTYIADITVPDPELPTHSCDAFDIAPDGTAWISLFDGSELAKLNLEDGTTSGYVPISGDNDEVTWIAIHPTSGVVYLADWDDDVYTIDLTTGATTFITSLDDGDLDMYDAAFDSSSRLWVTAWPNDDLSELYSADVGDIGGSFVLQGTITVDGNPEEAGTDSLWIVRGPAPVPATEAPALAATGLETAGALGAGLALLVLGAGAFAVARTRRA